MPIFPLPAAPDLDVGEPTELAKETAHVDKALSRLLVQFKDKPRIRDLITAFVDQIQDIEDAFWDLLVDRTIDNAVGAMLDILGRIVGARNRSGDGDDQYRLIVKVQIAVNRSNGSPEALLNISRLLWGTGNFRLLETFPAAIVLTVLVPFLTDPFVLAPLLKDAVSAGVGFSFVTSPDDPTTVFEFGSAAAYPEDGSLLGFSSVYDGSVGGVLAVVV
jgi:hypothetical protein